MKMTRTDNGIGTVTVTVGVGKRRITVLQLPVIMMQERPVAKHASTTTYVENYGLGPLPLRVEARRVTQSPINVFSSSFVASYLYSLSSVLSAQVQVTTSLLRKQYLFLLDRKISLLQSSGKLAMVATTGTIHDSRVSETT